MAPEEFYEYLIYKHIPKTNYKIMTQKELFLDNSVLYYNNEKTFLFLGHRHQQLTGDTIDAFSSVFKRFRPKTTFLEIDENTPQSRIEKLVAQGDEVGIGARLSFLFESTVLGINLSRATYLKILSEYDKKQYTGIELGVYWNFVSIYRYFKGNMLDKSNEEVYEKTLDVLKWEFLNENGSLYSYKNQFLELMKQYSPEIDAGINTFIEHNNIKNTGKSFSDIQNYEELTVPFPYCVKYPINKASAYLEAYRNTHIIERVLKELETTKSVALVIGSGHVFECKDILNFLLSEKFGMNMKKLSELS
ncbi:MAG: hypothetical protein ACP5M9_02415 [Candidatus Micrarchaeia archaeon]